MVGLNKKYFTWYVMMLCAIYWAWHRLKACNILKAWISLPQLRFQKTLCRNNLWRHDDVKNFLETLVLLIPTRISGHQKSKWGMKQDGGWWGHQYCGSLWWAPARNWICCHLIISYWQGHLTPPDCRDKELHGESLYK